ncbi:DUF3168 domain-containing protein, partial [Zavarzinella formosa]|uniref:DUF3168 domain-containing protein n=1 Tax=Zavarzinella formosa TaxID=360055 RepID=UPI001EE682FD
MSSPDNALQAGIFTRLVGYAPLVSALGSAKIYDHVPQDIDAPYVVIGDDTTLDWDTKSRDGWEFTLTLHCWDYQTAGRKSVKNILSLIHDALHNKQASVTVSGFTLVMLRREFQETFQETG